MKKCFMILLSLMISLHSWAAPTWKAVLSNAGAKGYIEFMVDGTFVVPSGVTTLNTIIIGGGGGGVYSSHSAGGGGGGSCITGAAGTFVANGGDGGGYNSGLIQAQHGQQSFKTFNVSAGQSYSIYVGGGGGAGGYDGVGLTPIAGSGGYGFCGTSGNGGRHGANLGGTGGANKGGGGGATSSNSGSSASSSTGAGSGGSSTVGGANMGGGGGSGGAGGCGGWFNTAGQGCLGGYAGSVITGLTIWTWDIKHFSSSYSANPEPGSAGYNCNGNFCFNSGGGPGRVIIWW